MVSNGYKGRRPENIWFCAMCNKCFSDMLISKKEYAKGMNEMSVIGVQCPYCDTINCLSGADFYEVDAAAYLKKMTDEAYFTDYIENCRTDNKDEIVKKVLGHSTTVDEAAEWALNQPSSFYIG